MDLGWSALVDLGRHCSLMNPYAALRPLLFQFDPEHAHELAFLLFRALETPAAHGLHRPQPPTSRRLAQEIWGLHFANPVGLAAGFDKSAKAPHIWPAFGFGFAEMGTITALAQPGNPKPRLFRLPDDRGLINRMGFNNDGAEAVAARLRDLLRVRTSSPLGMNIGKSKVTPLENAVDDYLTSFRLLYEFGDYFVINVSSPNTPGLRDLQGEEQLDRLAGALAAENRAIAQKFGRTPKPLLVKLAPDLGDDGLAAAVAVAQRHALAGLVATNTTIARPNLKTRIEESGGLSGPPLRSRATDVIRFLRRLAGPALPIIGVGGIFTAEDAYEKIRAGASLVQIYTGFIYEGPAAAFHIVRDLDRLLARDGHETIAAAVGSESHHR